jgi:hypothetical protein
MGDRPTYGNWRLPARPGIGPLGVTGTAVLLGGLVVTLVTAMVSWAAAGAVAAVVAMMTVPLAIRTADGRSGLDIAVNRVRWAWCRRSGRTVTVAGPLSAAPGGRYQLPGPLADTEMLEGRDAHGRPIGVVHDRRMGTFAVALECDPDGGALVDPAQADHWVAGWGAWLANLAHEPGLLGAAVTVETAPDTGTRLAAGAVSQFDPAAPQVARDLISEVAAAYPAASSQVTTWVTLTFRSPASARGSRRADRIAGMLGELAVRVPPLAAGLAASGAGVAWPAAPGRIAAAVRAGFDPAAPAALEPGGDAATAGPGWHDCGPGVAEESADAYYHEGAVSRTWVASESPRGTVRSGVLRGLLEPSPLVPRKRVTLLYRPLGSAAAARAVETDRRTAHFMAASSAGLVNARASAAVRAAEQAAAEEAAGAGLTEFTLLVTATADTASGLRTADAEVANLAASARLGLRVAHGQQAGAFAVTLPAGVLPWLPGFVPARLRFTS